MANTIDKRVGSAVAQLAAERPDELRAAAAEAGLGASALAEIMQGTRRLGARELFVLSRRLSAPLASFHAPPVNLRAS